MDQVLEILIKGWLCRVPPPEKRLQAMKYIFVFVVYINHFF